MTRIPFDELKVTIKSAFVLAGMPEDRADTCAQVHTESTMDGVASHGLNRVERFVEYITTGLVDVHASPTLELNLYHGTSYLRNFAVNKSFIIGKIVSPIALFTAEIGELSRRINRACSF